MFASVIQIEKFAHRLAVSTGEFLDHHSSPSLYGVVGRKAGTERGYAYSQSLKDSGVTWDAATLDKWIADPGAVIPGNDMSPPYSGIADASVRKQIIAYLKTLAPK